MTITADRIAQFEKMAREDPTNDMAHFSLGNAYLQSGRAAESAKAFENCVAVNPAMSKAYQLGGQAMIDAGWTDKAVTFLNKGYEVATSKGDRMPQEAIAGLLRSIGREPPAIAVKAGTADQKGGGGGTGAGAFVCRRTGRPGTKMTSPPFRGPVGQWIADNISQETWRTWIGQGTKVINELRLDLSREQDQEVYDAHMREFLGIDDDVMNEIAARKS
jgi:Fe-S cluster biosynthesis and repair protein YggX